MQNKGLLTFSPSLCYPQCFQYFLTKKMKILKTNVQSWQSTLRKPSKGYWQVCSFCCHRYFTSDAEKNRGVGALNGRTCPCHVWVQVVYLSCWVPPCSFVWPGKGITRTLVLYGLWPQPAWGQKLMQKTGVEPGECIPSAGPTIEPSEQPVLLWF